MDAPPSSPVPAAPDPTPPLAPVVAAVAPSLVRRLAPLALLAAFGGGDAWLFQRDVANRDELARASAVRLELDRKLADATAQLGSDRAALEGARADRDRLAADLESARRGGSEELDRVKAEKAALERRIADLADRLGEAEAARATAEAHGKQLDELVAALARRRINARRLAGLEAAPRLAAEVVNMDERRVPPVLVLRADVSLAGVEEGDVLYVAAPGDKPRESGRAVVERIDFDHGLLQARVTRLDSGVKIAVGDRLTTYPPGN